MATLLSEGAVLRKDIYWEQTGYIPHPGQVDIHFSQGRHRVVVNGRRWGKTLMGAKEAEVTAFVRNLLGEPQRGWIVGPEYSDCEKEFRIIYDSLKKLGVDTVSRRFVNNVENGSMAIRTNWGWEVECRSAKHPESLVGEGLDWVLMVEAGRHRRRTWAQYIRPTLSDKRGWSMHTGVPEGATDNSLLYHLYQRGQDPTKRTWHSWRRPSWTNTIVFPGGRVDPEILEAEDDLTEDEFRRQYGAEFVDQVGRVMKEWDDDIHLTDVGYQRDLPLYAAIDYGYTNDWVWLLIQVTPFDDVIVIEEKRWKFKDTQEIAEELKDHPLMPKIVRLYPDPAAPDDTSILTRILRKPAATGTGGEIKTRISMIRQALKLKPEHAPEEEQRPKLFVNRNCTMLAWEMREGYRWPETKADTIKNEPEVPMDKDNHGPEALGRFFKGYFGAPTRDRKARMRKAKVKR
jgi:hypothetical protein